MTTGRSWPRRPQQVVGYNQISRWTLTADGKSVEPNSERVILRVPKAKIGGSPSGFPGGPTDSGPGHVGGAGLDFDSDGNLYLGVGDDVSPNASGHSGYAPMDYRSAERWDARKTSANTADLRGKVLRIKPTLAPIASGLAARASARRTTIPPGNLFPVGTAKTRPEIYAMGFRQPFTLHTDPKNPGLIGVGEYCHDASDRPCAAARRPARASGTSSTRPATMGWPFCVGDQSPANTHDALELRHQRDDRARSTTARTDRSRPTSTTRRRARRPTRRRSRACDRSRSRCRRRSGRSTRTPATPGMQSAADFGDLTAGGMQPIAGPIYRYNGATAGSGGFPAYYDGSWLINNRGANDGFWKEVRLRSDNNQMLRVQRLAAVQPRRHRHRRSRTAS